MFTKLYLAEKKLTNNNPLFFIIMYTLIHVPNFMYFWVNIQLLVIICFIHFFIIVYNMCSYCKCQICQFVRYVYVIEYVMFSVSIFHNFTSLKLLYLFRFDMSTMVVTFQLTVDIMALFIQIFYDCS